MLVYLLHEIFLSLLCDFYNNNAVKLQIKNQKSDKFSIS